MRSIDILKAGSLLSRLVQSIEQGQAREIVIERDGRPVARLVPIDTEPAGKRIGVAKGKFEVPESIDTQSAEVDMLVLGRQKP